MVSSIRNIRSTNYNLYFKKKQAKSLQKELQTPKKESRINTMNTTLNTLINTINMEISENVIDGISSLGYSRDEAVKLVNEYSDFDIVADAAAFPVTDEAINSLIDQNFEF